MLYACVQKFDVMDIIGKFLGTKQGQRGQTRQWVYRRSGGASATMAAGRATGLEFRGCLD